MAPLSGPAVAPLGEPAVAPLSEHALAPLGGHAVAPLGEPAVAPLGEPAVAPLGGPAVTPLGGPAVALLSGHAVAPLGEPAVAPFSGPAVAPLGEPAVALLSGHAVAPLGEPAVAPFSGPAVAPLGEPAVAPLRGPAVAPLGGHAVAPLGEPAVAPLGEPAVAPLSGPAVAPLSGHAVAGCPRWQQAFKSVYANFEQKLIYHRLMIIGKPISERIRYYRKRRGWTQKQLALMTGGSRRRISRFETRTANPRSDEVAQLAAAYGTSVERFTKDTDWKPHRLTVPRLDGEKYEFKPKPARPARVRFEAAYELMPHRCRQIEAIVRERPDFEILSQVLAEFELDSGHEALFAMRTLERGALAVRGAPSGLGFRTRPVIDEETLMVIGDCFRDGLKFELGGEEICIFPQVTLKTYAGTRRIDYLCRWRGLWFDLEIDGPGHNSSRDKDRSREVGIPVVRLVEAELLAPEIFEILERKLRSSSLVLNGTGSSVLARVV